MELKVQKPLLLPLFITIFIFSILPSSNSLSYSITDSFVRCFSSNTTNPDNNTATSSSQIVFTPNNPSYQPILQSSIRNLRFSKNSTPKPILIVTPHNIFHIQSAVTCSKQLDLQVRVRSGGHDYEGLSYTTSHHEQPFIIIDLFNLRSITINLEDDETAWVESGATVGEFYQAIAKASNIHGFPAGTCPTIGIGGHVSGGGFGTIFRKYGLAADNVVDAVIVDSKGRILNRTLMGEDLFWAIRGGGGSSFGIITSWKVKIVRVPPTVTVFDISTSFVVEQEDEAPIVSFMKWQNIADKLPGEIFLHAMMGIGNSVNNTNGSSSSNRTVTISFTGLYLGGADKVVSLMSEDFEELDLKRNNCKEISWIQSVLYFFGFSVNSSIDVLLQRNQTFQGSFKLKSDYVRKPIPLSGLKGLWKMMMPEENNINTPLLQLTPYGGRMNEISESETPFPHRRGIKYGIQYLVRWDSNNDDETEKYLMMMMRLFEYMTPYVSENPRAAYLNYRDLDLGVNRDKNTSYEEAKASWGSKYFKNNFERLAKVKASVDAGNFFWNEQSIPPLV